MEHELILDDYTTRDDGRRSAVGHHHDSGRQDHAASRPVHADTARRTAAQRFWDQQNTQLDNRATIDRITAIRHGSPLTLADAPIVLVAICRSCISGLSEYELCRWFRYLDLRGKAWFEPCTIDPDELKPILAQLLADGRVFCLPCAQVPHDQPPPRRPFPCTRFFASDYPDFCDQT